MAKTNDLIFLEVFNKYLIMITNKRFKYKYYNKFCGRNPPEISSFDYLFRIYKYSTIPQSILAAGYIIARRAFPDGINEQMIHRVIFTSVYLAFKMYIDTIYIRISKWSKISGLPKDEITGLELAMLEMIDYRLYIKESEFLDNFNSLKLTKIEDL
jgi:hypothetical protein